MRALGPDQTAQYLALAHSLRSSYQFYDAHVHPYEVLFDRFSYQEESSTPGVFSLAGKDYSTPSLTAFQFPELGLLDHGPKSQRLQDISIMLLRKVYANVGPRVFLDQMDLAGIDRALMLPIALESGTAASFEDRMQWLHRCYGGHERFSISGSVPASVGGSDLRKYVTASKEQYGIRAMKCHPVVSGIDVSRGPGRDWLQELVTACHHAELPLIIHGGRNNPYWGGSRGDFGALEHLQLVDFSRSSKPVVIAHAGLHRCKIRDVAEEGLALLETMLETHPNLYLDISNLTLETLKHVLNGVPMARLVFGSDSLYSSQWMSVVLTLHALRELGMDLEENYVQLASINPKLTLFED